VSRHEYHEKEEREKEEEMFGSPGVPSRDEKQERKQKQRDKFLTTRRKGKKNVYRRVSLQWTGRRSTRPVEETTGATSISTEGAFFATSDVSDVVAIGEEVEETESEFCTETCAFED
jgi:hypothetical protein